MGADVVVLSILNGVYRIDEEMSAACKKNIQKRNVVIQHNVGFRYTIVLVRSSCGYDTIDISILYKSPRQNIQFVFVLIYIV